MSKPILHLGQQVVVSNRNGDYMATVKTGLKVSDQWRYGVVKEDDASMYIFVYEHELSFILSDGDWVSV